VLKRVRSARIYVSDQQRALDFFTGTLGCELLTDEPMGPGTTHAKLTARGVRFTEERS
jgi:catechol 2,3-dioxygenase-like lactoylglutathione lyase family enzyme